LNTLPKYYDAVYVDDNTYTFASNRLFTETKSYAMEDIVHCHMNGTSDIWVKMYDGEKIQISYGITTHSKTIDDNYSTGV